MSSGVKFNFTCENLLAMKPLQSSTLIVSYIALIYFFQSPYMWYTVGLSAKNTCMFIETTINLKESDLRKRRHSMLR